VIDGLGHLGRHRSIEEEEHMLDVFFLAATVFFVAVAILYVRGC
jgi:hypothetical protein